MQASGDPHKCVIGGRSLGVDADVCIRLEQLDFGLVSKLVNLVVSRWISMPLDTLCVPSLKRRIACIEMDMDKVCPEGLSKLQHLRQSVQVIDHQRRAFNVLGASRLGFLKHPMLMFSPLQLTPPIKHRRLIKL